MIQSRQDYLHYVEADRLALRRSPRRMVLFMADPVWAFQRLYRKVEYTMNCHTGVLWRPYLIFLRFRLARMRFKLGFWIPYNAIGPGLCLAHPGPIVIHDNVRIGANCRINVGVVIGENRGAENVPTIGSDVVIEPGAKLFGRIQIADGIHIGANAVVNKSFLEPGIVIAGVPAHKIKSHTET